MKTFCFTSAILNNKKRQDNFLPLFYLMSEENFSSFVSDGLHSAGGLPLHKGSSSNTTRLSSYLFPEVCPS